MLKIDSNVARQSHSSRIKDPLYLVSFSDSSGKGGQSAELEQDSRFSLELVLLILYISIIIPCVLSALTCFFCSQICTADEDLPDDVVQMQVQAAKTIAHWHTLGKQV